MHQIYQSNRKTAWTSCKGAEAALTDRGAAIKSEGMEDKNMSMSGVNNALPNIYPYVGKIQKTATG